MYKLITLLTIALIGFIGWVTYSSNLGERHDLVTWAISYPYGDKMGHFLVYGLLNLLLIIVCRFRTRKIAGLNIYWGSIIVVVYVVVEEISQLYFPARQFDLLDLGADTLGILLTSCLVFLAVRRKQKMALLKSSA